MSLEKILRLAGSQPEPESLEADLLLSARLGLRELAVCLAKGDDDSDDDGDDDSGDGKDSDSHADHATYKALVKKGVPPKRAMAMCAKADSKVKASALADSLQVVMSALAERDVLVALAAPPGESASERRQSAKEGNALPDGSYPIPDVKHLHSAAVLAASGHGNVVAAKRLIRKRARELGVELSTLPGFGGDSDKDEKVAATMVMLAAGKGAMVAMHHSPMTGTHSHPHQLTAAHEHEHQHFNDNSHQGGPAHRPGSTSAHGMDW